MNEIEKYISENNYDEAIEECLRLNLNNLGILLSNITDVSYKHSHHSDINVDVIETDREIVDEVVENQQLSDNDR